jgi:hypothetical protein
LKFKLWTMKAFICISKAFINFVYKSHFISHFLVMCHTFTKFYASLSRILKPLQFFILLKFTFFESVTNSLWLHSLKVKISLIYLNFRNSPLGHQSLLNRKLNICESTYSAKYWWLLFFRVFIKVWITWFF